MSFNATAKRDAGNLLLNAKLGKTIRLGPDVALDTVSLGRDLVIEMTGGRPAFLSDGRYVDAVGADGTRYRVFTRTIRPHGKQGKQVLAKITGSELSFIRFADPKDRPDVIKFVVVNPITKSVDVFTYDYTTEKNTINVTYSRKNGNYNSSEQYLTEIFLGEGFTFN